MTVPCRKCPKCLQFRQMQWREKALAEIERSWSEGRRTWVVCLSFSPVHLAGIYMEARRKFGVLGDVSTRQLEWAAYRHVQKYFKRLRKAKCEFRYLAVYERGEKSGRSHYHLLLHEAGSKPIVKNAHLEALWRSQVHARLIGRDEAGVNASYVTKYATKSLEIRLRASSKYGISPPSPEKIFPKESFFGVQLPCNSRGETDDTQARRVSSCDPALEGDHAYRSPYRPHNSGDEVATGEPTAQAAALCAGRADPDTAGD